MCLRKAYFYLSVIINQKYEQKKKSQKCIDEGDEKADKFFIQFLNTNASVTRDPQSDGSLCVCPCYLLQRFHFPIAFWPNIIVSSICIYVIHTIYVYILPVYICIY